jgi:hypothetical protein
MGSSGSERVRSSEAPMDEKCEAVRVWMLGGFRVSVGSRSVSQSARRLRKAAASALRSEPSSRMRRRMQK